MRCDLCNSSMKKTQKNIMCINCGLVRREKIKVYKGQESSWGCNYAKVYEEGIDWRKIVAKNRMKIIETFINKKIINLDFGGATGIFSKCLIMNGYKSENFEPDTNFRKRSLEKGITTYKKIEEIEKEYNVITFFDSLGYSNNLLADLESLKRLAHPDALLFGSFGYTDYGLNYCPDHSFNYYFHTKSLEKLSKFFPASKYYFWVESRSSNVEEYGTRAFLKKKFFLTEEPKVTYLIIIRGKLREKILPINNVFWKDC